MNIPALVPPESSEPPAEPRPRLRDRLAVAAFLIVFLIPMFLRAVDRRLPIPAPPVLAKVHDIACLFTHKPQGWSSYYVQVLYPGDRRWTTLDQSELFPLQPFGRRTRMHRLLVAWRAKPSARTQDMARWILERHVEAHRELPIPAAIRFTRAWMIPSREHPPQQGWRHPTWIEVPPKQRKIIAAYSREELLDHPPGPEGATRP